jgi:hypothetical protein
MSVVDQLDVTGQPATTEVVWSIDVDAFKAAVVDAVR